MECNHLINKTMNIYESLTAVNREVEAVKKEKENKQQGFKFRGIDDAYNALHALFAKFGIIIFSEHLTSTREERPSKSGGVLIWTISTYKFIFVAGDGSFHSSIFQGEAMDSGDKSCNKAYSGALKYALLSMFLIPTEDIEDADKVTPELGSKPSPKSSENKPVVQTDTTPKTQPKKTPKQAEDDTLVHGIIKKDVEKITVLQELKTYWDNLEPTLKKDTGCCNIILERKHEIITMECDTIDSINDLSDYWKSLSENDKNDKAIISIVDTRKKCLVARDEKLSSEADETFKK